MPQVVFSLGSNIGTRRIFLKQARIKISEIPATSLVSVTQIIETEPLLVPNQPRFLNQLLLCTSHLPPYLLLRKTQQIEQQLGRSHVRAKGPRVIDIDIIIYGNLKLDTRMLTVPHAGLSERAYLTFLLNELK